MTYSVEIKKSAVKAIKKIPREDQIKIVKIFKQLAKNPRPESWQKLGGSPYYRVRCGVYRIIYDIQEKKLVIIVLKIGHRKDVYKKR